MAMQHSAKIVGRMMLRAFDHRIGMCCDMSAAVGSSLKMVKFEPTTPIMPQHVVTWWANARMQHVAPNNLVDMLRSFGRAFIH